MGLQAEEESLEQEIYNKCIWHDSTHRNYAFWNFYKYFNCSDKNLASTAT